MGWAGSAASRRPGGTRREPPRSRALLGLASLLLPLPRDRLGISARCAEETLVSGTGWVMARCGQR